MSNYPPQPADYYQMAYPPSDPHWRPPRPGMGCGMKLLVALGVIFLLLTLLFCGGVFLLWSSFKLTQDRAAVEAIAAQITDIDVPQVLQPAAAMNARVPVVDKTFVRFAAYSDKHANQESFLLLFSLGEAIASQNQEKIRESIEQALEQQGAPQGRHEALGERKEEQKEMEIRGRKATFTIAAGKGARSGVPRIEVEGTFQGKAGPVVVLLDADATRLSEGEVLKMLESIR
ncbi:MAG: hypothetical protein ABSF26_26320 [Thermoguttaceae bacterium]